MYFRSTEGQKQFNYPDQIGSRGDNPRTIGTDTQHSFTSGDVLLVYSDGVSDNLFSEDFPKCFKNMIEVNGKIKSSHQVADCIALIAYHRGKNPRFDSPFAKGAREAG
jgi:hypothetical protein